MSSLGRIVVIERVFKHQGHKRRPFMDSAKVRPRGSSGRLQRFMVDFGADTSFAKAVRKLKEHHSVGVSQYALRNAVLEHGQRMLESQQRQIVELPETSSVGQLIGEMDGSMLPLVEVSTSNRVKDRRKTRTTLWKEARLSLVREQGKVDPVYGCTGVGGSTTEAGKQLELCALIAGAGLDTKVHAVGDGAAWVAEQFEAVFGAQATYLLDFYHVCDYLAAAAPVCAKKPKAWLTRQKNKLKAGQVNKVLSALGPYLESPEVETEDAPVRACIRYLTNRLTQLGYKAAIEKGLPIGSGEIESAHRHVLQARLKLPGAWWKLENANKMIALRLIRANGFWETYWKSPVPEGRRAA